MSHDLICDFCDQVFNELGGVWESKGKIACQECGEDM